MATARAKFDGRFMYKGVVDRPSNLPFDKCIELSSQLSKIPINNFEEEWEVIRVVPKDIVPILHSRKIDFMLVGVVPDRTNVVERAKGFELMRGIASGGGSIKRNSCQTFSCRS